tara:strand:- start:380 stop:802 length:423 start_codon:yes stop_codon:yes gene_type:complete
MLGPITGLGEESMGNMNSIDIGEAIVSRALAENTRLPDQERRAISQALDMATSATSAPDTVRVKFREIDAVLRRALHRKESMDDVKAVLQAIDVLGVPQGAASLSETSPNRNGAPSKAAHSYVGEDGNTYYYDVNGNILP